MAMFIPVAMGVASMVAQNQAAQQAKAGANLASQAAITNATLRATEATFEADQLRVNAGQEVAAGQRGAIEARRQGVLTQSRAIATAAAGGGSIADPTVVNILARNAGEGVYRAGLSLYQGQERARQMRMQAEGKDYEASAALIGGDAQARAYQIQGQAGQTRALAAGISSASTLYSKYGLRPPSPDATSTASGSGLYLTAGSEDPTAGGAYASGAW